MARLILVTAEGGQQTIDLRTNNSLGRHPNNSIQLLDKIVSKEHCIIEQRGDHFVLRDLGSLNGTYINGERVRGEGGLRHGDEIALGATRARYDDGSGRPMSPAYLPPSPGWQQAGPGLSQSAPVPPTAAHAAHPSFDDPTTVGRASAMPGAAYPGLRPGASPLAQSTNSAVDGPPGKQQPPAPSARAVPIASGSQNFHGTRIDVQDQDRAIGTQIAATQKGFLPYEQIAQDAGQLRADYERLRASHELSREIALERDTTKLVDKILASIFKFIRADRGVIFLKGEGGELTIGSSRRRDGTDAPIQVSATILNHVMKERAAVLTHDAAMDFAASKGKSMILNRISSAIVVPLLHNDEILGVLWLDSETLAQFQRKDLELVTAIVNQAAMFIEINILAKKIEHEIVTRERFSRLLSPNVAERVISGQLEIKKGGELVRECTVFNSDIRGFTRMSEKTEPQIIVDMLNEYFELMVDSVFKFEGTLDKFMGDGIMALWGAPVAHPDDATLSVRCALEQMRVLGEFNRSRMGIGQPPLAIGIGIHTGPLVAGYIGSSKALSYTVVGDTANTSARLCGIAHTGQIIVSESTYARLGSRFEFEELPPAHVKNKENALRIFNVTRERPQVSVPQAIGA
ncbi:MAG TPA: adenylate/guanylate cyclase domain-containing protein [Polyangiaceae bacterium]|nr:adenylate/guanylate cyclase domain-containing protein [Polyangiaceae bacterium]